MGIIHYFGRSDNILCDTGVFTRDSVASLDAYANIDVR